MEKQEALLAAKAILQGSDINGFFAGKNLQSELDGLVFTENGNEYIFRFDGENLLQDEI